MKIIVAGAGAGKTTSMAELVLDRLREVKDGKFIYVITYTNAARNRIREKIIELNGSIPKQLFIETSHAFLLREFIFPFHHLLYEQQFLKATQIKLPDDVLYRTRKLSELATNQQVHVDKVTEIAKWIISGKSSDRKAIKVKREKILTIVLRYLDSIFIDEAQDIDEHLVKVIEVLNAKGINMCLVGDPKQDLRGRNAFKEMILTYQQYAEYKSENHRCPISHIELANSYVSQEEKQISQTDQVGKLSYIFESDIDLNEYLDDTWDSIFILKKNDRFITHTNDVSESEASLEYELKSILKKSRVEEQEIDKFTYIIKKWVLINLPKLNNSLIFRRLEGRLGIILTKTDMGKLGQALKWNREKPPSAGILVNSIDSVKGLEGDKCLFILTTELAPYLFKEKNDQNKMLNYLYVALTRSKEELVLLITNKVEEKYGREFVDKIFREMNVINNLKDSSMLIRI